MNYFAYEEALWPKEIVFLKKRPFFFSVNLIINCKFYKNESYRNNQQDATM